MSIVNGRSSTVLRQPGALTAGVVEVPGPQPGLEGRFSGRPFGVQDGEPRRVAAAAFIDGGLAEDAFEREAVARSGAARRRVQVIALPFIAPISQFIER